MAGPLDEIFRTRTNGNGYVQQEWDDILLKREISQLVAEGRVAEEPCEPSPTINATAAQSRTFPGAALGQGG